MIGKSNRGKRRLNGTGSATRASGNWRRRSDAFLARSVPLLPGAWLYQYWWPCGSNHHDVQPHGRAPALVVGRSFREDHGVLPHAAWARSPSTGDLCWVFETQIPGRHSRWPDFHRSRRRGDDFFKLAVCRLRQSASGKQRLVCFEAVSAGNHKSRHYQTWQCDNPKLLSCRAVSRRISRDALGGHQPSRDPLNSWSSEPAARRRLAQHPTHTSDTSTNDRRFRLAASVRKFALVSDGVVVLQDWAV